MQVLSSPVCSAAVGMAYLLFSSPAPEDRQCAFEGIGSVLSLHYCLAADKEGR